MRPPIFARGFSARGWWASLSCRRARWPVVARPLSLSDSRGSAPRGSARGPSGGNATKANEHRVSTTVVETASRRITRLLPAPPCRTHLLSHNGILQQYQMREFREGAERIQIRQLSHAVCGQDQRAQVRYRLAQRRLYRRDAVSREKECLQARREREVGQCADVVVCEVDRVLILRRAVYSAYYDTRTCDLQPRVSPRITRYTRKQDRMSWNSPSPLPDSQSQEFYALYQKERFAN